MPAQPSGGDSVSDRHAKVAPTQSSTSLTNLIGSDGADKPVGIIMFGRCFRFSSPKSKRKYHQALMLLLTFIAYATFHMGRRPLSIVKNVLNRDCSKLISTTTIGASLINVQQVTQSFNTNITTPIYNSSEQPVTANLVQPQQLAKDTSCDWAPFDDDATANQLLAYLDTAFLLSYALFMFSSGFVAERANLRYFISAGCILSGFALIAFGVSYPLNIHSMVYFVLIQIFAGAAQTTGWPVVVTCVGNWFDASSRGTVYGLWNSHTNLGNILGATIAGYYVETDWGLSFIVPGAIMIAVGLLLFLFLVSDPKDVDLSPPPKQIQATDCNSNRQTRRETLEIRTAPSTTSSSSLASSQLDIEHTGRSSHAPGGGHNQAISFMRALRIPGVIEYSLCLFFSKLVSYTFLYWLPRYITASTAFNSQDSAYLSTPFDIGGIAGSILAGYMSDKFKVNGIICNLMLLFAIPSMFAYQTYGARSSMHNILLQLVVGLLVNGPYCLITTSVSADLGYRIKDGHAMATVSAIIDGMGSVGAVLGPLFAGFVSSNDWHAVFWMLMISDVLAAICIIRITIQDIKSVFGNSRESKTTTSD